MAAEAQFVAVVTNGHGPDHDVPVASNEDPFNSTSNTNGNPTLTALGANGSTAETISRPTTPMSSMALTEYSANPSTPPSEARARIRKVVPDDYLLPDGFPDV